MASLVERLAQELANRPGVDMGQQAVKKVGPAGAMYLIGRKRELGLGPEGAEPRAEAIADRFAEGAKFRDLYGPVAPFLAGPAVSAYEGVGKPMLSYLPDKLKALVPEGFRPGPSTSPSGGREAMLRALATMYGSLDKQ